MMPRLRIPYNAKVKARRALKKRQKMLEQGKSESEVFGITKQEAKRKGINSGVVRAKQLISNDTLSFEDTKRVAAFYQRFKNKTSSRAEGALDLWGGRNFGRTAVSFVKTQKSLRRRM